VARLAAILSQQGVPLTAARLPSNRLSDQGSLFATVDLTPPSSRSGQAFSLAVNGGWNRQAPASPLVAELPSHAGERRSWTGGAQARHSSYVRNVLLSETTLNLTTSASRGTPYLALPNGSVIVASTFDDGTSGVRAVSFGGNPALDTRQRATGAGLMNHSSPSPSSVLSSARQLSTSSKPQLSSRSSLSESSHTRTKQKPPPQASPRTRPLELGAAARGASRQDAAKRRNERPTCSGPSSPSPNT
jgi:hypothetical protein